MNMYGNCNICGGNLKPSWFKQQEYNNYGTKTGRVKNAVDYLICECCFKKFAVDDSFDGAWHYE